MAPNKFSLNYSPSRILLIFQFPLKRILRVDEKLSNARRHLRLSDFHLLFNRRSPATAPNNSFSSSHHAPPSFNAGAADREYVIQLVSLCDRSRGGSGLDS